MQNKSERKIFRQFMEGVIAIGLVLIFFFIIMSVLNLFFPSGGGFSLFMEKQEIEQVNATIKREHDLMLLRDGQTDEIGDAEEWAAHLTATRNDVKSKRATDIAWRRAKTGMRLYNLDAVQTLDQSTALIHFDDQNEIDLGENSLIVIRRMEQDLIFKEKRSYMVVVDGELRGRIGGADDEGVYLEITTPNAVTRLQNTSESDVPLEFRINVEEDNASTITLFSGEAEVEAQGEIVTLEHDQMTRIDGMAPPSIPIDIPKPIKLKTPTNASSFAYRSLPPKVQITWHQASNMTGYRLQLARDRKFRDMVLDERLQNSLFVHGNLHAGDYFWRVSGMRAEEEGAFSQVRHFSLIQDDKPPKLEVIFPAQTVTTPIVELTGQSEPDSHIFIAGEKIQSSPTGEFSYSLQISRGMNVIVVEAVDQAGNVSYSSEMINGVY
jgi:hypothetical protein